MPLPYSNNPPEHTCGRDIPLYFALLSLGHRLRKKILNKFGDNNFIKNNDKGYYI